MKFVIGFIVLLLVAMEYISRKQKTQLNETYQEHSKEAMELMLESIEGLKYTYGKIFAYNLEDQSLILLSKKEYLHSELLMIMHEVGHFFHFRKNKDAITLKVLMISKAAFYFLGILSMFTLVLSVLFSPLIIVFKYLLILLIIVQSIHLLLLTQSEVLANTYIKSYFEEPKESLYFVYTSMVSQMLYWFLFIVLTLALYGYIFT